MSKIWIEGNPECVDVHLKVYRMFREFTPCMVDQTKAEVNEHLKRCEPCRLWFLEKWKEKEKEREK